MTCCCTCDRTGLRPTYSTVLLSQNTTPAVTRTVLHPHRASQGRARVHAASMRAHLHSAPRFARLLGSFANRCTSTVYMDIDAVSASSAVTVVGVTALLWVCHESTWLLPCNMLALYIKQQNKVTVPGLGNPVLYRSEQTVGQTAQLHPPPPSNVHTACT
jgi:hypothetical protein